LERQEILARISTLRQEIQLARQVARNRSLDRVTTPKSGVIWEILVQEGERVIANQPMVKVLDCSSLWVEAFVTVDDLKRFEVGAPAKIDLHYRDRQLQGNVETIRSYLGSRSDLGKDVAVQPPDFRRKQLVQVRISLKETEPLLAENRTYAATDLPSDPRFCNVGQLVQVEITPTRQLKQQQSPWFSLF
jgi:multidrug resistance efflux pump